MMFERRKSTILEDVCDDTHAYVFALATRCNKVITGSYSQNYVNDFMLYGVRGWYFIRRNYPVREYECDSHRRGD